MNVKAMTPWQVKLSAKIVLSRLPLQHKVWSKLGLFRIGSMDKAAYAYGVFKQHFDLVRPQRGFISLELGPGDTLAGALLARSYGGYGSVLVDAHAFASQDLTVYRRLEAFLASRQLATPSLAAVNTVEEMLACCHSRYLTLGLASLTEMPAASVDFIYSHAVLEHVRAAEFKDTLREMRRVLRPGGSCSHRVDLQDHLGGALNNLRFSDRVWESDLMAKSGFYTNRIRFSQMLTLFEEAGFSTDVIKTARWPALPTPKRKLAGQFRALPDDDLCISSFMVVLRPM